MTLMVMIMKSTKSKSMTEKKEEIKTLKMKIDDCDRQIGLLSSACSQFKGRYLVITKSDTAEELKKYRAYLFDQIADLLPDDELEKFVFGGEL